MPSTTAAFRFSPRSFARFAICSAGGTYTLEISALGHEPHRQQVTFAADERVGPVRLRPAPAMLREVTTNAEPAEVQLRSGAVVVDARAAASAGGTIADFLRTVPGLELDADGRIGMRGSTSVLVLMNGQRIPLAGDALLAFLRQMPAAALERVEAGTTASARHEADGAAGVVNLVFRDRGARRTGSRSLAGSVATGGRYMGVAAVSGDVRDILAWDATYSLSAMRPLTDSRTTRRAIDPESPISHMAEDSRAQATHHLHSLMAGATVAPTATVSLGLRGAYSWMDGTGRSCGSSRPARSAARHATTRRSGRRVRRAYSDPPPPSGRTGIPRAPLPPSRGESPPPPVPTPRSGATLAIRHAQTFQPR